jgi:hypothetical protein
MSCSNASRRIPSVRTPPRGLVHRWDTRGGRTRAHSRYFSRPAVVTAPGTEPGDPRTRSIFAPSFLLPYTRGLYAVSLRLGIEAACTVETPFAFAERKSSNVSCSASDSTARLISPARIQEHANLAPIGLKSRDARAHRSHESSLALLHSGATEIKSSNAIVLPDLCK